MEIALDSLNEALESYNYLNNINPYRYSLTLSINSFIFCVIVAIIGFIHIDVLKVLDAIYPIYFLVSLFTLIYTIVTRKRRNKLDFAISIVTFLAATSIFVQCLIYFYRATTGNFYYTLFYDFPGILKFNRHVLTSVNPNKYNMVSTIALFDPTLIVSFICLILSTILYNLKKKENYKS